METGLQATFVMSWSQTEVDGVRAAPIGLLAVGASWSWSGAPVRVDDPQDRLLLVGAEGMAELRRRAARSVQRLIGAAVQRPLQGAGPLLTDEADDADQTFVVTDGRKSFTATVLEVPDTGARLLMFVGELPSANADHWVVRSQVRRREPMRGDASRGGVICFATGTALATPEGLRRIEDLRPGDRLATKDSGPQEVLWIGHRRMTGARLHAMPHLRPIRFRSDALGQGRPDSDLLVSPQHRMLVTGSAAQSLFNSSEVLVAAEDLLNDASICVDHAVREVTYVHVLLERHQIVWANGLETESFHPSNTSLETVEPVQRAALYEVLPELAGNPHVYGDHARRNLTRSEAAILRHDARF